MTDVLDLRDPGAAEGDGTEARLLAAAAEVFAEKGYDRAGVAEIARRAGLTTGAIYSRFSGKAELLTRAIRNTTPDELDQLFAQHAFDDRAADLLATVGAHLVDRGASTRSSLLAEALIAARRDPDVAVLLRQIFDERRRRLRELIEQGQAAGAVDPDLDAGAVVHFAHAVGLGFLLYDAIGIEHPGADAWQGVIAKVVGAMDPEAPIHGPPAHAPESPIPEAADQEADR